jgi:hypothetical protein
MFNPQPMPDSSVMRCTVWRERQTMDTRDELKAEAHSLAEFRADHGTGGFYDEPEPLPLTPSDVFTAATTYATLRTVAIETGDFRRSDRAIAELQRVILAFGQQCADDGRVTA